MPKLNMRSVFYVILTLTIIAGCGGGGGSGSDDSAVSVKKAPPVNLNAKTIPQFVDPLPDIGAIDATGGGSISVRMREASMQILPTGYVTPGGITNPQTWVWRYEVDGAAYTRSSYLGPVIVAKKGVPLTVNYFNELGDTSTSQLYGTYNAAAGTGSYVVDQTVHWAAPTGMNMTNMTAYTGPIPAVAHLHGGEVPSAYDGGPNTWFTQSGLTGSGYTTSSYTYPNNQEAAPIWYHDHTLGATRLNVYAGLAGGYLLTDPATEPTNLPQVTPLVIQDRMFDNNGQLFFPHVGINPANHPFWVPEFFGDTIVVNGKTWPYLNVEPKRYRFLLLNGSNARFYELSFGIGGPAFWVVRTDGGYLDAPVQITSPGKLLIAPGERYEVVVDFAGFANQNLILTNTAKAPYPKGASPDPQTTGQIMQFRVAPAVTNPDATCNPALGGCTLRTPMVRLADTATGLPVAGIVPDQKRQLTLKEILGAAGPLEVLVNNAKFAAAVTENPRVGSTEVWEIINLTADAHPIHLHLVQFQLLNRQPFNVTSYGKAYAAAFPGGVSPVDGLTYPAGAFIPGFGPPLPYNTPNLAGALGGNPDVTPYLQGAATLPLPHEAGWKDTFIMHPGEVTRVIARWAPQDVPVGGVSAGQNAFTFDPTLGPGYVWHCHIIDHEDNEMMRPYMVLP